MAISDTDYAAWLVADNKFRVVLVEAGYHDGVSVKTFYASNYPYVSGPTQSPANTVYEDLLGNIPAISSRIDSSISAGAVQIHNKGEFDEYLDYAWRGYDLGVYIGDPEWDRDDFRLILSGLCGGISAPDPFMLELEVRDKREQLEVKVESTTMSNGELKPLLLGACFNVSPPLEDSANHRYRVSSEAITGLVVRDNGVVISVTQNTTGTFDLGASPAGAITCDATGSSDGTAAGIVEYLALRAGISAGEINSTNLSAFPDTSVLGVYLDSDATCGSVMTEVMASVGGYWKFSRVGKLEIVRLTTPGTSSLSLDEDDIEVDGLTISNIEQPMQLVKLGYNKNWTIQDADALAGAVTEDNRSLYGIEYLTVTSTNLAILTEYPLAEEGALVPTFYTVSGDAQAECDRRKTLRGDKRFVYKIKSFYSMLGREVGDTITITSQRFGFSEGKDVVVIGLNESLMEHAVEIEAWA